MQHNRIPTKKGVRGLAQFRIANLCLTPFVFAIFAAWLFIPGNTAYAQGAAPTLPAPAAGASYALPADHLLQVLEKTTTTPSRAASDASAFSGTVKIGGATIAASSALMIGHAATAGAGRESMKSETARHGIVIYSPNYADNNYFPGVVWGTSSVPKLGIWGQMTGAGSKLFFGTSNNYTNGITNQALTIDQNGKVGIGFTNPSRALVVMPLTRDGTVARFIGNPWTAAGNTSRIELGDDKHYFEAKWGGPFTVDSADNISIQPTNGNVGIGTTAPTELLQLGDGIAFHNGGHKLISFGWSPGNASKALRSGFPAEIRWNPSGYLQFGIDTTSRTSGQAVSIPSLLTLHENGNIGIGTVTPWQKLDIAGNASLTGGLYVNDWLAPRNNNSGLRFFTNKNNQWLERIRITPDGNVGIGTTAPSEKLDVAGSLKAKDRVESRWVVVKDTANAAWPRTYFESKDVKMFTGINQGAKLGQIDVTSDHPLVFYTKDAERMRITNTGNIGIGYPNPGSWKLAVNGNTFINGATTIAGSATLRGSASILGDTYIGGINNGASGNRLFGYFHNKPLTFFTTPTNAGGYVERMRITPDGNVGIGTTEPITELHIESHDQSAQIFLDVQPGNDKRSAIAFAGTFKDSAAHPSVKIPAALQAGFLGNTWDQAFLSFHVGGTDGNCMPTGNNFPCTRMIIRNNGNVGIGTTDPKFKLDVNGTINVKEIFKNGSPLLTSQWTTSGNTIYYNTGNVGIGTTSPDRALVVKPLSSSGIVARFIGNPWSGTGHTSRIELGDANHYLEAKWGGPFTIDSADNIAIQPTNGNVGIGTISPQSRLTILGSGVTPGVGEAGRRGVLQIQNNTGIIGGGGLEFKSADGGAGYGWSISAPDSGNQNVPLVFAARRNNAAWKEYMRISNEGKVGIGITSPRFKLDVDGSVNVSFDDKAKKLALNDSSYGMDVAELFDSEEVVEEGDIVIVSKKGKNVRRSTIAYQQEMIGVVSSAPAVLFEGSELKLQPDPQRFTKGTKPPVTLAGRVPVKVSLENGPIRPGDYLTSSSVPGVAMKATEPGPTLGLALESYEGNKRGTVLTFINLGESNNGEAIQALKIQNQEYEKIIEELQQRDREQARRLEILEQKIRW